MTLLDSDLANSNLSLSSYSPVNLMAGDAPDPVDTYATTAVAVTKYQVVALNAAGAVVAWDPAAFLATGNAFAAGVLSFSAAGTATDTITINGQVITMVASGATGYQINVGASATLTAQALLALVNANPTVFLSVASGGAATITLTAILPGTAGNAIATVESGTGTSFAASTFAGGTDIPGAKAPQATIYGVAMQPAGSGVSGPFRVGGCFNIDALTWPAAKTGWAPTNALKIAALFAAGIVGKKLK